MQMNGVTTDRGFSFLNASGIAIVIVYLLAFPTGYAGLGVATIAFVCFVGTSNRASLGVFLLLWGPPVLGAAMRVVGAPGVGTVLAYLGALLLLLPQTVSTLPRESVVTPMLWGATFIVVLALAYIYGPMTTYSANKLLWSVSNLLIVVAAFYFLACSARVNMFQMGLLGIGASTVQYASMALRFPEMMPRTVFEVAGLRMHLDFDQGALPETNVLAFLAASAALLCAGSVVSRTLSKGSWAVFVLTLLASFAIIVSTGQRIWLVALPLALLSVFLVRPQNTSHLLWFGAVVGSLFLIVSLAGARENFLFVDVIDSLSRDSGAGLLVAADRDRNFFSAINRIAEAPWLGHGLGGYFVDGYSASGEGTYAHNVVLELLSETGLVGTGVAIFPGIVFVASPRFRSFLRSRTVGGYTFLPLLVLWFIVSMATWDLKFSSGVIGIMIVAWMIGSASTMRR